MTIIDLDRPEVSYHDETTVAPPTVVTEPGPDTDPRPTRRPLFGDVAGPLSRAWVITLLVAWVVVVAVGLAVEPPPANPDAAEPLIATMMSMGMLSAWGAMAAGMAQRRRFAAAASLIGAAGLLAMTVACPLSGHHSGIGAWWGIQMAGATGLLALSHRALRSS